MCPTANGEHNITQSLVNTAHYVVLLLEFMSTENYIVM